MNWSSPHITNELTDFSCPGPMAGFCNFIPAYLKTQLSDGGCFPLIDFWISMILEILVNIKSTFIDFKKIWLRWSGSKHLHIVAYLRKTEQWKFAAWTCWWQLMQIKWLMHVLLVHNVFLVDKVESLGVHRVSCPLRPHEKPAAECVSKSCRR